jgi:hypothetical protein
MNPKALLFIEPLADDGLPLFASQREMAHALVALHNSGFDQKQPENVRIFLGQVLKPSNETGARPLSANLRRAIPNVVKTRIADEVRASAVSDQIIAAIDGIKEAAGLQHPYSGEREWAKLFASASNREMKHIVIITREPAETKPDDTTNAHLLSQAMIERVIDSRGHGSSAESAFDKDARYDFFIPEEDGRLAWLTYESLLSATKRQMDLPSTADAQPFVDDAMQSGRLSIFSVNNAGFLPSMCVFEPLSSKREGYHLYYHEQNQVSVCIINENYVQNWISEFYFPVYNGTEDRMLIVPFGKSCPLGAAIKIDKNAA